MRWRGTNTPSSSSTRTPGEVGVAQQLLERPSGDPGGHEPLEVGRVGGGVLEQRGLVLGEHAARGAQAGREVGHPASLRDPASVRRN